MGKQKIVQKETGGELSKKPVSEADAQVLDEISKDPGSVKSAMDDMKSSVEKRPGPAVENHGSSQTVSAGRPEEGVAFAEGDEGQNDTIGEDVFSTIDLLKEIQQLREQFFRAKAETANILKRSEREMDNTRKYFVRSFLVELLEVLDSLEKAAEMDRKHATVEHYRSGLELTLRSLEKFFAGHDVAVVDPTNGVFDPELHQAMGVQKSADSPSGTILNVVQKGYTQRGRLLRPALVIVSDGQEAKPAAEKEPRDTDEDK